MKINNLKINGFGKLKNRNLNLENGINIIYGENESGKSTCLKFISSMLYGSSKNKNGKELSDFDKFKPWETEEFSGKISYTLDNGEEYEVYREFKKKNPIIYNSLKEDISKNFSIDKTKGIEFFKEQTGIDEETFYATAITEQEGVKLSKSSQNSIIQKISNLVSSGDDNISFKKSLDKINRSQNEEVGTERTSQRPINIVDNKIHGLLNEKKNLEIYKENIYDNSLEKEALKKEEKDIEAQIKFLKELKNKQDHNRLKNAEINFNKNLEEEYNKKIKELNRKIDEESEAQLVEKANFTNYYIAISIFIITFIAIIILAKSYMKLLSIITIIPICIMLFKIKNEKNKILKAKENTALGKEKLINELEILKQNKESQEQQRTIKEENLLQDIEKENRELIDKYLDYVELGYMQENVIKNYDNVLNEIEQKENRLNTIRFKLQTMESHTKDINNKLDDLAKIEEELQDAETEKEELLHLNNSYNIAKECLEKAYEKVKANISPRFTENLSDIISKISNGRYSKVNLKDTEGLMVEIPNGSYVPATRLSVGTVDQMYISLRLSALEEISEEKMPIILDEAFAYFDNERLKNILKYLNSNFRENQIIIFTCSNREEKALKELKIDYNICNL